MTPKITLVFQLFSERRHSLFWDLHWLSDYLKGWSHCTLWSQPDRLCAEAERQKETWKWKRKRISSDPFKVHNYVLTLQIWFFVVISSDSLTSSKKWLKSWSDLNIRWCQRSWNTTVQNTSPCSSVKGSNTEAAFLDHQFCHLVVKQEAWRLMSFMGYNTWKPGA